MDEAFWKLHPKPKSSFLIESRTGSINKGVSSFRKRLREFVQAAGGHFWALTTGIIQKYSQVYTGVFAVLNVIR